MEKANHTAAQRWWRNLPDDVIIAEAQARLDTFCARVGDARIKTIGEVKATVEQHVTSERLTAPPATAYPATMTVSRIADAQCLVSFRGNRYSVPPELAKAAVNVCWRLDAVTIDINTVSGTVVARHHRAPDGAAAMVRDTGHVIALEHAALQAFDTGKPHRRKERIPPGPAARAAAEALRNPQGTADDVVIDLSRYAAAAEQRKTLPANHFDGEQE